jgi:hypothetical protein
MARIFISYSRTDGSEIADELADKLRALGHEIFLDVDGIRAGHLWKDELRQRVHWSKVLLVIVTPYSNNSDYVYEEVKQAEQGKKLIIPIQVNDTPLPVHLRGTWNAIKITDGNLYPALLEIERTLKTSHKITKRQLLIVAGLLLLSTIAFLFARKAIEPSLTEPTEQAMSYASTATYTPSQTNTSTPYPTVTPTTIVTPTPTPIFLERLIIPSTSNSGITYDALQTGLYTFEYSEGTYSIYGASNRVECENPCFSAEITGFLGTEASWAGSYLNTSEALFNLNADQDYSNAEDAEIAARGAKSPKLRLHAGEQITILTDDGRDQYADNTGEITLSVYIIPEQENEITVEVPARASWIGTGITLQSGQVFIIRADGTARTCGNCPYSQWVSPNGLPVNCYDCVLASIPEMALIGRVGTGNAFKVGTGGRFTSTNEGELFLRVNDNPGGYDDNVGSYEATIIAREP